MPAGYQDPIALGSLPAPTHRTCDMCARSSIEIYTAGWMCLNDFCPAFWKLEYGVEPIELELQYNLSFLKQYTPWQCEKEPHSIMPSLPSPGANNLLGDEYSITNAKGMVCPRCGRCNSREHWSGWRCKSPGCNFELSVKPVFLPAEAVQNIYFPTLGGIPTSRDIVEDFVATKLNYHKSWRINTFIIPGSSGAWVGVVKHYIASTATTKELGGADDIFADLQTTDNGLQRRPMSAASEQLIRRPERRVD